MQRITDKQLQAIVDRINRTMGTPATPYKPYDPAVGRAQPNAKCYHLSHAYGGVSLHQMSEREGCTGARDVFGRGHMPKRELAELMHAFLLAELMHAFLRGVDAGREG